MLSKRKQNLKKNIIGGANMLDKISFHANAMSKAWDHTVKELGVAKQKYHDTIKLNETHKGGKSKKNRKSKKNKKSKKNIKVIKIKKDKKNFLFKFMN